MKRKTIWLLLGVLLAALLIFGCYLFLIQRSEDLDAPLISLNADEISVSVEAPRSELLQGVTAWDAHDGDVTASVLVESVYGMTKDHRATVTYAAFDQAGNVSKAERTVYYTDYESPRFTLSRPLAYPLGSTFDIMSDVGAQDILEGNIQRRIKATMLTSGTSVSEQGTHSVQFRVTNILGDTAQLVLPVEVYPSDAYNAQLTLTEYLVYVPQGADFDRMSYLSQFSYLDEELSLRYEIPENLKLRVSGLVNTRIPGVYAVTYTASCTLEEQTYTGYTKLLVVVEE